MFIVFLFKNVTRHANKRVVVAEKVKSNSISDEKFKIFTVFFILSSFMAIFESALTAQIPALQGALLGMCKKISFSESKLLSHLCKAGPSTVLNTQK